MNRLPALSLLLAFVTILTAMVVPAAAVEPYRVGPSDRLSIRVIDWQDAEATVNRWSAVSGEYAVGPDGAIAFPFMPPMAAIGKTPVDLAKELRSGLRLSLGLSNPPDVTVEIVNFGAVYVTGEVSQPGAYPFSPRLTVLQSISLAGGLRRGDGATATGRDLITLQGTYNVLREQRVRLLVRRARLDALINGSGEMVAPAGLEAASVADLVAAEAAELKVQMQQADNRIATYAAQESLIDATLEALEQKRLSTTAQLEQMRAQLEKIQGLVDSGLAVETRASTTQTAIADLESRLLDLETAKLRAQQDRSNAALARTGVSSEQFLLASRERRQVDSDLSDLEQRLTTQLQLIGEAATLDELPESEFGAIAYRYMVTRAGAELAVGQNDVVQPGDVVTVSISTAEATL
ncbi:MAG: hypothetical protein EOP22_06975 [Hyphomicrobiales bacterium]|nr:MAG: hypothetical protein EOP22_06975 [Hyphomicrobiales bacterium]